MLEFAWRLPETAPAPSMGWSTGVIFLRTLDGEFPSAGWRDFVLVLMETWTVNATNLLAASTRSKRVDNPFFEGPYDFAVDVSDSGLATLSFWRRTSDGKQRRLLPVTLPLTEYAQALLASAESLLRECRATHFGEEPEIEGLGIAIDRLSSILTPG